MEIKKDPKVNLESRKTTYLLSGLVVALAVLFIGLEWSSTETRKTQLTSYNGTIDEEEEMMITIQNDTPPPPPPPPAPEVFENIQVVDDDVEIEEVEMQNLESDDDICIEVIDLTNASGPVDEEETEGQMIHTIVDQNPEFPGGEKALLDFIKKTLKYPAFAAENGIQGRVVLSFVVERDGSIAGIEVVRTPAEVLSKEAIRVTSSMPKWKPGKQHGRTVRVKYVLPVVFRLA